FNVTAQSTGERTVLRFVVAALASPSTLTSVRRTASLESLVVDALDRGASDITLSEGRSPRLRFAGQLESEARPVTTAQDIETFLGAHMTSETRAQFDETGSADLAYTLDTADERRRFRANLFRHQGGLCLTLRPIRDRIPTLEELGLPRSLAALAALPDGMVLLNGPAGSGKSTTRAPPGRGVNPDGGRH